MERLQQTSEPSLRVGWTFSSDVTIAPLTALKGLRAKCASSLWSSTPQDSRTSGLDMEDSSILRHQGKRYSR